MFLMKMNLVIQEKPTWFIQTFSP